MTRLLLSLILIMGSALGVKAQTLLLRSGDHGNFTRLAAELPQGTEWQVDATASGLSVFLSGPLREIDTDSVFRRISRNRVADIKVAPDGTGLEIMLGCDCGFRSYVEGGSLLVIDIGESIPRQARMASFGFARATGQARVAAQRTFELPLFGEDRIDPLQLQFGLFGGDLFDPSNLPAASDMSSQHTLEKLELQTNVRKLDEAEAMLLAQMGLATEQGLLTPVDPMAHFPTSAAENAFPGMSSPNFRMRLATEPETRIETGDMQTGDATFCPERDAMDLQNWGNPVGFSTGLSTWRQKLMLEFDRIDSPAVLGLSRHYLHYGFGQEAAATLALLPQTDPQVEILTSMARIIDLGHDPQHGPMSQMFECGGPSALWSVLSVENIPPAIELNTADLRLAFESLPRHLKQHLGPKLATRLSSAGDDETADVILSSVSLSGDDTSPALEFARAQFSLRRGDGDSVQDALNSVLETSTELSPEALAAIVDTAVSADQAIDDEKVDLVAAYLFENRQSAIAGDLERALVLALAHSGQFAEAFDRLAMMEANSGAPPGNDTRLAVMSRLVNHASDIEFLAETLASTSEGLPPALGNSVAKRLLTLGFAEMALAYLPEAAEGPDGRERRIMRAKAALAMDEPVTAEAELLGLSGEDIDVLRADARRRQGNYADALRDLVEPTSLEQRRDSFSPGGDVPSPSVSDDDLPFDATGLIPDQGADSSTVSSDPSEPTQPGMLQQAESLIADSGETRSMLQNLLTRLQVDPALVP